MWLEFWWFSLFALGLIGWMYGRSWRAARWKGGFYTVVYIVEASLVVFLIFQAAEPMLFRFLEMVVPTWVFWRLGRVPMPFSVPDPRILAARRLRVRPASLGMSREGRSLGL